MNQPGSEDELAAAEGGLRSEAPGSLAKHATIWTTKQEGDSEHFQLIDNGPGCLSCRVFSNGTPVDVKYNGECLDWRRSGKGCLTTNLPSEYDGEWVHGRRHGCGIQKYPSANVYEGQWLHDMKSGIGIMKWIDQQQVYEGEWQYDMPDGLGTQVWFHSCPGIDLRTIKSLAELQGRLHLCNRYQGEFKNGQRQGQGVFFYSNGAVYKGGWAHNLKHGPGTFTHINGRVMTGVWDNDILRSDVEPKHDVVDKHPTSSLDFYVQCEDLLPVLTMSSTFSNSEMISKILLRYNDDLRRIFEFYGFDEKQAVPRLKLSSVWIWFRDCNLRSGCLSRAQIDAMAPNREQTESLPAHDGNRIIFFRECHELLVRVSATVYAELAADRLSDALNALFQEIILPRFKICSDSIASNRVRSSLDVMARMAPFEGPLRSVFDQFKNHATSTMPSRTLFRLLQKNNIPSDTILTSFNDTYRCDLTDNNELAIKPVELAADEILHEEMVEIVGRSIMSFLLLTNTEADLSIWIQTFCNENM